MTNTEIRDVPPLHDVDIRLLRVFKTVVESGGFSAAEEQLGVGRSTISKHISGLEDRLNFRLCERGRAGFAITPHGETVYAAVIELLDALDNFRSKVSTAKGYLSGAVHLWTMDNSHNEEGNPLAASIDKFKERPGNAQLLLNAATPKLVEDSVAAGQAHIGLTIARGDLPGINYCKVSSETTSVYCAVNHPKFQELTNSKDCTKHLAGCDFVMRAYLRNEQIMNGKVWHSSATSGHVETTLQLVLSGRYLGVIPDHMAARWVASGEISRVLFPGSAASTDVNLVFRVKSISNPTVKAMIEDILSVYQVSKAKTRQLLSGK